MKYNIGSFHKGLVDRHQQGKFDQSYSNKLLKSLNYFMRKDDMLTRRPPAEQHPLTDHLLDGEILQIIKNETHYIVLRKVDTPPQGTALQRHTSYAGNYTSNLSYYKTLAGSSATIFNTNYAKTAQPYTVSLGHDIVAIDFYHLNTNEIDYSKCTAFAILKYTTSEIDNTPISNDIIRTEDRRVGGTGANYQQEPIIIGIYEDYHNTNTKGDIAFIPPYQLSPSFHEFHPTSPVYIQDIEQSLAYTTFAEMPLIRALKDVFGSNLFSLSRFEFLTNTAKNIETINLNNDRITFTFCGLSYIIENNQLHCINSIDIVPNINSINQESVKSFPSGQFIERNPVAPINIYFGFNGLTPTKYTTQQFVQQWPDYAHILEHLSHTISYIPAKGSQNNSYLYAFPDLKFLIPSTDISAASKFITRGINSTAWFGCPTTRGAALTKDGYFTTPLSNEYPSGNGHSFGGFGAAAASFRIPPATQDNLPTDTLKAALNSIFLPDPTPDEPLGDTVLSNENINLSTLPSINWNRNGNDDCYIGEDFDSYLDAYIYIEYDYESPQIRSYFADKDILLLPQAQGRGYKFDILKKSGIKQEENINTSDLMEYIDNANGYVAREWNDNRFLQLAQLYQAKNVLGDSLSSHINDRLSREYRENNESLLSDNSFGATTYPTTPLPLFFSARASYYNFRGTDYVQTPIKNFYIEDNILSYNTSAEANTNIFNEYLKNYFNTISNVTLDPIELTRIGIITQTFEPRDTDADRIVLTDINGLKDNILGLYQVNDRIIIHTQTGLSRFSQQFVEGGAVIYNTDQFSKVALTSNIVADSSAILGASETTLFVSAYTHEAGGYIADDINKDLNELSKIDKLVDFFGKHRLLLATRKNSNSMYALSQQVDRRFKGFAEFSFPFTIQNVIVDSDDQLLLIDTENKAYKLNFSTTFDTVFRDYGNVPIKSEIQLIPFVAIGSELTSVFDEYTVDKLAIGVSGHPYFKMCFDDDFRSQSVCHNYAPPSNTLGQSVSPLGDTGETNIVHTQENSCTPESFNLPVIPKSIAIQGTNVIVLSQAQEIVTLDRTSAKELDRFSQPNAVDIDVRNDKLLYSDSTGIYNKTEDISLFELNTSRFTVLRNEIGDTPTIYYVDGTSIRKTGSNLFNIDIGEEIRGLATYEDFLYVITPIKILRYSISTNLFIDDFTLWSTHKNPQGIYVIGSNIFSSDADTNKLFRYTLSTYDEVPTRTNSLDGVAIAETPSIAEELNPEIERDDNGNIILSPGKCDFKECISLDNSLGNLTKLSTQFVLAQDNEIETNIFDAISASYFTVYENNLGNIEAATHNGLNILRIQNNDPLTIDIGGFGLVYSIHGYLIGYSRPQGDETIVEIKIYDRFGNPTRSASTIFPISSSDGIPRMFKIAGTKLYVMFTDGSIYSKDIIITSDYIEIPSFTSTDVIKFPVRIVSFIVIDDNIYAFYNDELNTKIIHTKVNIDPTSEPVTLNSININDINFFHNTVYAMKTNVGIVTFDLSLTEEQCENE